MKIKQKVTLYIGSLVLVAAASLAVLVSPINVEAQNTCGGVDTSIISCPDSDGTKVEESGVWFLLVLVINILTAGVGVAALAGIVYGAVLYTSAGGNPEQVKKAMGIITNVVIGVIAFAGMYTLVNFLIPGGLF